MDQVVTATHARIHFGEILRRVVEGQQRIIVERAGQPAAVILSVAEYERLKAARQPDDWHELLLQARERVRAELGERQLPNADEIIRAVREERDEYLVALH